MSASSATGATSTAVVASASLGVGRRLEDGDRARVEQRRQHGRDEGAPEERPDEVAGGLGLEAVEPQEGRDDDAERDDRDDEGQQRGLHAERGAEVRRDDEGHEEEADPRDAADDPPPQGVARRGVAPGRRDGWLRGEVPAHGR